MTRLPAERFTPRVYKDVVRVIPSDVREWANEMYAKHLDEWAFEDSLDIAGALVGSNVAVRPHTDFDFSRDQVLWGLVIESEGHVFHVEGKPVGTLQAGDVYVLDPSQEHGTWVPEDPNRAYMEEAKLILGVIDRPMSAGLSPAWAAGEIVAALRKEMVYQDRGPHRIFKHGRARLNRFRRIRPFSVANMDAIPALICAACGEDDPRHDADCPKKILDDIHRGALYPPRCNALQPKHVDLGGPVDRARM